MLSRPVCHRRFTRRGAAAAELAILLPFLAMMFVVAIDFARVYYYGVVLGNCARNAAYYAGNYPQQYNYANATTAGQADGSDLTPSPNVVVAYDDSAAGSFASTSPPASGGYVKATVSWQFSTITNYPFPGMPNSFNLSRTVVMRICPLATN